MDANSRILNFFFNLPAFLIALTVHEYAHGFIANKLGDSTAKRMGRLTFNPLAHIDPVGTILVPLFLISSGNLVFGWAKPVPVNFYNLKNPKKDMIWVGLAGPAANFIAAFITYFILKTEIIQNIFAINFLTVLLIINIVLGVFNLIPIPPLDGSRILMGLLPPKMAAGYARSEPYVIKTLQTIFIISILYNFLRRMF
ncbi:MAG: site-2 protease family protein [PVC group bacterium]|nr:site-2 protease family protein [PVC group bacterium]